MTTSFEQFQISDKLRNKMKRVTNRSTLRSSLFLNAAEGPEPQNTVAGTQDVILVYRDEVRFDGAYMVWRFEEAADSALVVDHENPVLNDSGLYDPAPRTIVEGLPYFNSDGVQTSSDDAVTGRGRFHPAPGAVEFWMRFNGISGLYIPNPGFATVPDHPSLDITGDIDIRWFGALNSYAAAAQVLVAKHYIFGNMSWYVQLDGSGFINFGVSPTGGVASAATSSSPVPVAGGQPVGLRITRVQSTGVVTFQASVNDGLSWTSLGTSAPLLAGQAINSGSDPIEIGVVHGNQQFAVGYHHRVEIRNGIDGTPALDVRFTDADQGWAVGDTGGATGVDATGKTVTLSGGAEILPSISVAKTIARITADPDVSDEELTVTLNVAGTLTVDVYDILPTPTLLRTVTSLGTVDNNQWRYVVVNDTGSDLSIYLDGEAS